MSNILDATMSNCIALRKEARAFQTLIRADLKLYAKLSKMLDRENEILDHIAGQLASVKVKSPGVNATVLELLTESNETFTDIYQWMSDWKKELGVRE